MAYTKSKLFQIEGDQRSSGTGSNFTFDLGSSNAILQAKRIVLKAVVIPNVFYNITSYNNVLQFNRDGDALQSITVPPGFYTAEQLASVISTMTSALMTCNLTCSINTITGKFNWLVSGGTGTDTVFIYPDFAGTTTMGSNLGLPESTNLAPDEVSGAVDSPYIAQLAGLTSVNIHSKALAPGNYIEESNSTSSVLMNVPITSPFLGVTVYESTCDELNDIVYSAPRSIQSIDIRITDRQGTPVDLQEHNVKILCKVFY